MKALTKPQQRALYAALPASRKALVKKHCKACEMKGEGIMDILKSIGKALGPVARELGPVILKELILPMLKQKAGIKGKGLKLAGAGKKKASKKK